MRARRLKFDIRKLFARTGGIAPRDSDHPGEADAWEAYHHLDLDDHEACAKRLGITVASSYKRISRAQARLRLILLELQGDDRRRD